MLSLKRSNSGALLRIPNGTALMVAGPGGCCCEGAMCCWNEFCQIVDCDDPNETIIGSVDCDPCCLNFCGYCAPSIPVTFPLIDDAQGITTLDTLPYPLCSFVEMDRIEIESDISGITLGNTVSSAVGRSGFKFGCFEISVELLTADDIAFDVFINDGVNATFIDGVAASVGDQGMFDGEAKIIIDQISYTALNADCERDVTFRVTTSYDLKVLDPSGVLQDQATGGIQQTHTIPCNPNANSCGEDQMEWLRHVEGSPSSILDSSSFVSVNATQKPFTREDPKCCDE